MRLMPTVMRNDVRIVRRWYRIRLRQAIFIILNILADPLVLLFADSPIFEDEHHLGLTHYLGIMS